MMNHSLQQQNIEDKRSFYNIYNFSAPSKEFSLFEDIFVLEFETRNIVGGKQPFKEIYTKYESKWESLVKKFAEYHIDIRPMFYPVSSMPPFIPYLKSNSIEKENPIAYHISAQSVCLPNGYNLNYEDVKRICNAFKEIIGIKC